MKNLSSEDVVSLRKSIRNIVDPVLSGVSELTKEKVFEMFERYGDYYSLNIQEIATWEQFMGYAMMVGVIERFPQEILQLFQQDTKIYLAKVNEILSSLQSISKDASLCNESIGEIKKELKNFNSLQNKVNNLVKNTCDSAIKKIVADLPKLTITKNEDTVYYFRDNTFWNSVKYFIIKNPFAFICCIIAITSTISAIILSNIYHKNYIDNDNDNDQCEMYGENYWLCKTSDNKAFEIVIDSANNRVYYRTQKEMLERAQHKTGILLNSQ